jgi:putative membrane protein
MKRQKTRAPLSLRKALLAGLVGGLAGSAAKLVAEKLFPPRTEGQPAPPEVLTERAEKAADISLTPGERHAAVEGIHWGFGTVIGGIYGLVAELQPKSSAWAGIPFGLTLNRLTHQGVLPGMRLTEPPAKQPAQEKLSEYVTHAAYGFTTELVRRAVRKRL